MEPYLTSLQKPEVVIGIMLTIALIFMEPVLRRIRSLLWFAIRRSPHFVRSLVRAQRCRSMRKLKVQRRNGDEVTYQTIRAHTFFIIFVGSIAFYIMLIVLGPLRVLGDLPLAVQYFLTAPIYIFETLWLLQHAAARELIKSRGKLGVTNGSSGRSRAARA